MVKPKKGSKQASKQAIKSGKAGEDMEGMDFSHLTRPLQPRSQHFVFFNRLVCLFEEEP